MSRQIEYHVRLREYTRHMQGDREELSETFGGVEAGRFCDRSQAEAEARRALSEEAPTANRTGSGIGSITYHQVEVERLAYDEEYGEWLPCGPDGSSDGVSPDSCVLVEDDMTPELERAWREAKASYHAFLDYEAEDFYTVGDRLVVNRSLPADLAAMGATRRSPEAEAIRDVMAEARENEDER